MAAAARPTKKNRRLRSKSARLLHAATPTAVRRIACRFLAEARRARKRLEAKNDDEALHDFRVALRRLRSTLQIYRPMVDARMVPRKWRRRLKRLARTTGAARDAEVGLAWLLRRREYMTEAERAACNGLVVDWKVRRDEAYAEVRRTVHKEFAPLAARLSEAFAARTGRATTPPLAPTVATLLREQIAVLAAELRGVASITDAGTIHAARVEAKRLRYLLEPLVAEVPNGKALLKSLKKFQNDFGELCDRQMLREELMAAAVRYGSARIAREMRSIFGDDGAEQTADPDTDQGLLALARLLSDERKRWYADIEQRYLGKHADVFLASYRSLADTLANQAPAPTRKTPMDAVNMVHGSS